MPQVPSSQPVAVHRADGVVTVAVHGELGPATAAGAREQIAAVIASRLQRLILNLVGVSDRFGAECLALIAVTQHLLPAGSALEVCTASPAVRGVLALADWGAPDPAARPCRVLNPASSECPVLGMPCDAVACPGPMRAQSAAPAARDTAAG